MNKIGQIKIDKTDSILYALKKMDQVKRKLLFVFDGDVFYQDEAGSSKEAEALIKGEIKQVRDGRVDSISAMIILQRYLRSHNKKIITIMR